MEKDFTFEQSINKSSCSYQDEQSVMRMTQKPVIRKLAAYTKLYIISYDVDVDSSNCTHYQLESKRLTW
jgi:hypothetical protein